MLLGQIADAGIEVAPGPRRVGERRVVFLVLAVHFGAGSLVAADDGRKLEKVAHEHNLQAAEGGIGFADELANLADRGKRLAREHRDFIDDQRARLFDAIRHTPVFGDGVQIRARDVRAGADAAPGMDGGAADLGGGDARRRRNAHGDVFAAQIADIAGGGIAFAAAWLAGQKYVGAGLQNLQSFVLCHIFSGGAGSGIASRQESRSNLITRKDRQCTRRVEVFRPIASAAVMPEPPTALFGIVINAGAP